MPAPLLAIYDDLRPRRGGRAVARLDGDECSACLVAASPFSLEAARFGDQLVYCSAAADCCGESRATFRRRLLSCLLIAVWLLLELIPRTQASTGENEPIAEPYRVGAVLVGLRGGGGWTARQRCWRRTRPFKIPSPPLAW